MNCPRPLLGNGMKIIGVQETYMPPDSLLFSCSATYNLTGQHQLTCQADGTWNSEFPTCQLITCPDPPEIANARILPDIVPSGHLRIGTHVRYRCNDGFAFKSIDHIECSSDGSWNLTLIMCKRIPCVIPPSIENGMIVSNGLPFVFESVVTYSCSVGFRCVGDCAIACNSEGLWNSTSVSCDRIICPRLQPLLHGYVTASSYEFNSTVTYTCTDGYILIGESKQFCNGSGQWSGEEPFCQKANCTIVNVANAHSYKSHSGVSVLVGYRCYTGYKLLGSAIRQCKRDGFWDSELPICQPVNCSIPNKIINGHYIGSDFSFGHTVQYFCEAGYTLQGFSELKCLSNGNWSKPSPKCLYISCQRPIDIEHGSLLTRQSHYLPGTVIKYICDLGFYIKDKTTRTCRADGTWSGRMPGCKMIICQHPNNIANGQVNYNNVTYGSQARYKCNHGFGMQGTAARTCMGDRRWSGSMPTCQAISCDEPSHVVSNGRMVSTNFSVGAKIRYICDIGYFIDGLDERTCTSDGTWNHAIPVCEKVSCPRPVRPTNSRIEGYDMRYGESLQYACRRGFDLVGPSVRVCQANKTWSGNNPRCVKIRCPRPSDIPNGRVRINGLFFQNTVRYECYRGYILNSKPQRICKANGQWYPPNTPQCERIMCPAPERIANGDVLIGGLHFGAAIRYACSDGYVLVGSSTMSCSQEGEWIGTIPTCKKVTCRTPDSIVNGHVDVEGTEYGHTVVYRCDPGYKLDGALLRFCSADGSWSGRQPECNIIHCQTVTNLTNGIAIANEGMHVGAEIIFSCNPGFTLNGAGRVVCGESGMWSASVPVCEANSCIKPEVLHGYVIGEPNYQIGDIIEIGCETGYKIQGRSTLECLANQEWSLPPPLCNVVKCQPPLLDNGLIKGEHHDGNYSLGLNIQFECRDGYELVGETDTVCQSDGRWSNIIPKCNAINCPTPQVLNGNIKVEKKGLAGNFSVGSELRIWCIDGFDLQGSSHITCLSNRSWSKSVASCHRVECPEPIVTDGQAVPKLRESMVPFSFDTQVEIICDDGYQALGDAILTCQANKKWDLDVPACRRIVCTVPVIQNGFVRGSPYDTYIVGTVIQFECFEEYELSHNHEIKCLNNGSWSQAPPKCNHIVCPQPNIPNGVTSDSDVSHFEIGRNLTIVCNRGFSLIGPSLIICLENKQWSSESYCVMPSCTNPFIRNGKVVGIIKRSDAETILYRIGDRVNVECNSGYSLVGDSQLTCIRHQTWSNNSKCIVGNCPDLVFHNGVIDNKPDNLLHFTPGESIQLRCKHGFKLNGDSELLCQDDNKWSGKTPRCDKIECPTLLIPNGKIFGAPSIKPGWFTLGDNIQFMCENGYELLGSEEVICQANGTWTPSLPSCTRVRCSEPHLDNGDFVSNDISYHYGSSVRFLCNRGFQLQGENRIVCQANKTWTAKFPRCERWTCAKLNVSNGTVKIINTGGEGYTARISCLEGFMRVGSEELHCSLDGVWSGLPPLCKSVNCILPNISNLVINQTKYDVGDYIVPKCVSGFEMNIPNKVILCKPDGKWNQTINCLKISCPVPESISNGRYIGNSFSYNDHVHYECIYGYFINGDQDRFCLANKTWSGSTPSCKHITCQSPANIDNGSVEGGGVFFLGAKVNYTCISGYHLQGLHSRQCLANMTWSGHEPKCEPNPCVAPSTIEHGQITGNVFIFGKSILYLCISGYELKGHGTLTCMENGLWDKDPPLCEKVLCPVPHSIENGYIIGKTYSYGSLIEYKCHMGYELLGDAFTECLANKSWTGRVPECSMITCPSPTDIMNGRVISKTQVTYGSLIQYECIKGYVIRTGHPRRRCREDKQWSGTEPSCEPITCGPPEGIYYGRWYASEFSYNSVVSYRCDRGYELTGEISRICQENRRWSGSSPDCHPVRCPDPPVILNGRKIGSVYTFGSYVSFECANGYQILGPGRTYCNADKTWSHAFPFCRRVLCGPPMPMSNAVISPVTLEYGSEAEYECSPGYVASGPTLIRCQANGRWTTPRSYCSAVVCSVPPPVAHSQIIGDRYEFSDLVYYICDEGYEMIGNNILECGEERAWVGQPPTCVPRICGDVPVIDHSTTIVSKTSVGGIAEYQCNAGYTLQGSSRAVCNEDMKWTFNQKPSCVLISCISPPGLRNGEVTASDFNLHSIAIYRCHEGYVLRGSHIIQCQVNRNWNGSAPHCDIVVCPTPNHLRNGRLQGQHFTYLSPVLYTCDRGYELVGASVRVCQANGKWNKEEPTCRSKYQ